MPKVRYSGMKQSKEYYYPKRKQRAAVAALSKLELRNLRKQISTHSTIPLMTAPHHHSLGNSSCSSHISQQLLTTLTPKRSVSSQQNNKMLSSPKTSIIHRCSTNNPSNK